VSAKVSRSETGFSVDPLRIKTPFLEVAGTGDLQRGVTMNGTFDLAALESQFHDLIDFGALAFEGKGRLAGDYRKDGETFLARFATDVRGLKVAGLTGEPIVRDTARFDAAANGRADASGAPSSWENLRVNLKSSQDVAAFTAISRDDAVKVDGAAALTMKVSEREGVASAKIAGRWRGNVLELDELRLGLTPADRNLAAAGTLALAVKGKVDLDADTLDLTPLSVPAGGALVLGPEGLSIHGLRTTPWDARTARVTFNGSVAALDQAMAVWSGSEPKGMAGSLSVVCGIAPGAPGKLKLGVAVVVPDITGPASGGKGRKPDGPLSLTCNATYEPAADRISFEGLQAVTHYGAVNASGTLDHPSDRRIADLKGTIAPNWVGVTELAAAMVEPKAKLQGNDRSFHIKGPLSGDSLALILKGLDAELGVDLAAADVFGLRLGPAAIVLRCGAGNVTIDPIKSTLNNGTVDLKPALAVDPAQGIALQLLSGSAITGTELNDEVSKRVLSFIAPVLAEATNVAGKLSARFDQADIPLYGTPSARRLSLTGQVLFQDMICTPGPFAGQLFSLAGQPETAGLRLEQPVQLTILNGRVIQKGLEIPVRRDTKVAIEGSVGFDQTLDLRATVPVTAGMLGQVAGLDKIVSAQSVTVPIGGTVSQPRINRQALQVALKELTKGTIKGGLEKQASGLLNQLVPGAGSGNGASPADLKAIEGDLRKRVLPGRRGGSP
jgi:translocation and assembly module TamB